MIWKREEYIAHVLFDYTGKEMFTELFGLLLGLEEEWRSQGATDDEVSLSQFGWDSVLKADVPVRTGAITGIKPLILEDNRDYTISIDTKGRKQKLIKNSATIPLPLDYPVKSEEDWLKIKKWYEFTEERIDKEALHALKKQHEKGYLTVATIPGGFDEPRQLLGEEELCIAYYEQPELIKDMLDTISDTALKVFERVVDIVPIDNLFVHEDMAGKSGPLAGPIQIQEFIKPYYRKIWDFLSAHKAKIFSQDSDGNMNSVIEDFIDSGINLMLPFEPGADMDMVETRKRFKNRLAVKGGINKYALRGTKEDIRKELEYKICELTKGGGTIFAIDHRIPNGVPLENYRYYIRLGRELLNLPTPSKSSFVRMAF